MNASKYQLDFVIPRGEVGDKGPFENEPRIYVEYFNASSNGNIRIANTYLLPPETPAFGVENDYISFKQTGYFEFTISGTIKEETTNNGANVYLRTLNTSGYINNLIRVQLSAGTKEKTFFQTKVGEYQTLQKVSVILQKDNNSSAVVEDITLYIKKMPFPY